MGLFRDCCSKYKIPLFPFFSFYHVLPDFLVHHKMRHEVEIREFFLGR